MCYYDKISILDECENSKYIYRIKEEDKIKIYKNLTFYINYAFEDRHIKFDYNKDYLASNEDFHNHYIFLIKDKKCYGIFLKNEGVFNDFRTDEEIEKLNITIAGEKYRRKIKNVYYDNSYVKRYNFSILFDGINGEDLIAQNYLKKDNGKLAEYLDVYVQYIYSLIDECDNFAPEDFDVEDFNYYKKELNYTNYDKVLYNGHSITGEASRIFDIKTKEEKETFKKMFRFNITDEYEEYCKLYVDRDYLDNRSDITLSTIRFMKNDWEQFLIDTSTGYFIDFRHPDEINKSMKKFKELGKKIK